MSTSTSVARTASGNAGLSISLHPLPILNISEHHMRNSLRNESDKTCGVLLGTQTGREVSVINTFELLLAKASTSAGTNITGDVNMDQPLEGSSGGETSSAPEPNTSGASRVEGGPKIDQDFLEKRRAQYKEVFPTLDIVGWYSIGSAPVEHDVKLHEQFLPILETPLFLLLTPPESNTSASASSDLPLKIYESALSLTNPDVASDTSGTPGSNAKDKFVELGYTVETGEAERIAVDGAAKATGSGAHDGEHGGGDEGLVAHLNTQRNAISMLHDRMLVLLDYVKMLVSDPSIKADHSVVRQISALVSGLPVMNEYGFREEFLTEYTDVQLTAYLASLTRQVANLNDLTDKFSVVYQRTEDKAYGGTMSGMKNNGGGGMNAGGGGGAYGGGGGKRGQGGGGGGGKRKGGGGGR